MHPRRAASSTRPPFFPPIGTSVKDEKNRDSIRTSKTMQGGGKTKEGSQHPQDLKNTSNWCEVILPPLPPHAFKLQCACFHYPAEGINTSPATPTSTRKTLNIYKTALLFLSPIRGHNQTCLNQPPPCGSCSRTDSSPNYSLWSRGRLQ